MLSNLLLPPEPGRVAHMHLPVAAIPRHPQWLHLVHHRRCSPQKHWLHHQTLPSLQVSPVVSVLLLGKVHTTKLSKRHWQLTKHSDGPDVLYRLCSWAPHRTNGLLSKSLSAVASSLSDDKPTRYGEASWQHPIWADLRRYAKIFVY